MKRRSLVAARFEAARKIIGFHYNLTRRISDEEVSAEMTNLRRKGAANWDDLDGPLAARLQGLGYTL